MRKTIINKEKFKPDKKFPIIVYLDNNERVVSLGNETRQQKIRDDVEGIELVWEGDPFDIKYAWKLKRNKEDFSHGSFFR